MSGQARLEYLARVVARAFYQDDVVVVMDALIKEKFLVDTADGMGANLCLKLQQVRSVINELKADKLVCEEAVDGVTHYYIDHQNFYDVVNYRVYLILKGLRSRETSAVENQKFRCLECGKEDLLNAQMKHVCNFCGGTETLEGIDNTQELEEVRMLQAKFKQQMEYSEEPYHDGIINLLKEIDRDKLKNNLPSENLELGQGGEIRNREHTVMQGAGTQGAAASARETHSGAIKTADQIAAIGPAGPRDQKQSTLFNHHGHQITVTIEGEEKEEPAGAVSSDPAAQQQLSAEAAEAERQRIFREQYMLMWQQKQQQQAAAAAATTVAANPVAAASAGVKPEPNVNAASSSSTNSISNSSSDSHGTVIKPDPGVGVVKEEDKKRKREEDDNGDDEDDDDDVEWE